MECKEFTAGLGDVIDRRLDASTGQTYLQHAASCPDCGDLLRDHLLLTSAIPQALPDLSPPAERMWARIQAQLPPPAPAPVPGAFESLRALFLRGLVLAPVPAFLLLVAVLLWRQPGPLQTAEAKSGATGTSIHSSPEKRQIELNQKRWDYVESGFRSYARSVRTRQPQR